MVEHCFSPTTYTLARHCSLHLLVLSRFFPTTIESVTGDDGDLVLYYYVVLCRPSGLLPPIRRCVPFFWRRIPTKTTTPSSGVDVLSGWLELFLETCWNDSCLGTTRWLTHDKTQSAKSRRNCLLNNNLVGILILSLVVDLLINLYVHDDTT